VPLIWHPNNKNSVVVFDLRSDPAPLIALSVDEIYDRLYTRSEDLPEGVERIALKEIHINKAPVIAPLNVLNSESAERLAINSKQCELHRQQIIQSLGLINDKLHQLYQRKPNWEPLTDPDHRLYDGFLKPADKKESLRLRQTAPEQLNEQSWYFEDERLQELLFRYRARNWPEQLNAEERARWDEYRRERLIEGRDERSLTFEQFFEAITRLKEEPNSDSATLGALEQYGQELLAGLQNSTKQ
ncbi:MAG: exodeoxyribonuclease I, partial [Gammaproteobacteria bacterium]|nr:exodeoxyribonuclease I [Gammaproteobacteria bacterium]